MAPAKKNKQKPVDKIERYWLVTVAGLEEVALDELREVLPEAEGIRIERGNRHGRLFFTWRRSPSALHALRAPLSIYALLADYAGITPGEPGKTRLIEKAIKAPILAGIRAWKAYGDEGPAASGVRVRMQGRHRFSKEAVTAELRRALSGAQEIPEAAEAPLVLQVDGRRALWGVQLGRSRRREIGGPGREIQGPVAYCLGRILHLETDDLVVLYGDAALGLNGIRQAAPDARLVAVWDDVASKPTEAWAWNLKAAGDLPLLDCCSDAFVVSLPAGSGFEKAAAIIEEGARVLQPGGLGIFVTEPRMLSGLIEALDLPLALVAQLPLVLRGRRTVACLLERLEEVEVGPSLLQIEPGAG